MFAKLRIKKHLLSLSESERRDTLRAAYAPDSSFREWLNTAFIAKKAAYAVVIIWVIVLVLPIFYEPQWLITFRTWFSLATVFFYSTNLVLFQYHRRKCIQEWMRANQILPAFCFGCDYNLRLCDSHTCPECGCVLIEPKPDTLDATA